MEIQNNNIDKKFSLSREVLAFKSFFGVSDFIILLCLTVFLVGISFYNFLLFHTLAELFAIVVGIMMCVTVWKTEKFVKNSFLIFLATGFFWVAILDLIHTLSYKGINVFPELTANTPTQLWIASRYAESLLLLFAPLFIKKEISIIRVFISFFLIFAALVGLIFNGYFPDAYIEGVGLTVFKINSEYIINLILAIAIYHLWKYRSYFDSPIFSIITLAIIMTMISELAFTFYVSVYGISNMIGHIFKLFAFWLIYYAIVKTALEQPYITLEKSKSRMKGLIDTLPDLVWLKDKEGKYLACNPKFEKLYGEKEQSILGKTDYDFVSREVADFFRKNDKAAEALGKPRTNEEELTFASDGHKEWTETIKAPMFGVSGELIGVLGIGRDITDRKIAEEKILHQAHFDSLTNLANRFLSLDRLSYLMREAKRKNELVALLFIDLDDFKKVNDTLGHEAGDKLLIGVSQRLKGLIREQDTVGRLGGDEFIIMLGGLSDPLDARSISENILNSFRVPILLNGNEISMTLSIGISIFPNDGDTITELLRKADSAMYQAKSEGKNTLGFFTDKMNQNLTRRLEIERQIQGALSRNEFSVFYQPKVNLLTDQIMGAEALVRWSNKALGNVSPEEFIPIAEQLGVIIELGQFVLDEALSVAEKWQRDFNKNFNMAVNISPRQFRDSTLPSFINEVMTKYNISGNTFEIEITEGLLMNSNNDINDFLMTLSQANIGIAMDDFGTGYSSLSYLRQYPFSILKIDRSFINDITVDRKDKELVNAAIAMAHGLNLKVVAEGVETKEQLALLKEMKCEIGQGYLFSKAVPEEEFTQLFKD